ncbi:hypothetical protein ACFWPA_02865 [Rhodococcus sp. NPDC058505]|uniref:hypothetical protein n=1 Tax=unclassified Rhodococcus (in: high G+C Gram-positive bacteria) TaxID=192944 RepID=UPI00364C8C1B
MDTSRKNIARVAVIAGMATAALVATPAVGSAAVTGNAAVTTGGNTITVKFTDIASPSLVGCVVRADNASGTEITVNPVLIVGNPGTGLYVSQPLSSGDYTVHASCLDADGATTLTPEGGVPVSLGISFGSLTLDTGSLGALFSS